MEPMAVVGEQWRSSADLARAGLVTGRLEALCQRCQGDANADGVGLAIVSSDGIPEPTFVSDSRSRLIEDLQFTLGEGPCVDAVRSGSPVLLDDVRAVTDATRRWPAFVREAESSGVRALFAFPVRIGAVALGTLDLYRSRPGTLDADELAAVLRTVDRIALVLLDVSAAGGDAVTEPTYRMVVHQAAGMVMAQTDTSIASALARLRATAFSEGIQINELAADIVAGRRRFSKESQ
jgi:GAF domain-containing protein